MDLHHDSRRPTALVGHGGLFEQYVNPLFSTKRER